EPNAPGLGFPASVTDAVGSVALTSCQDASGFCIEAARPNPAAPVAVPGNFTPDGEGFYYVADAEVPGAGLAHFAVEQAFANEAITDGDQIMFSRIRMRFDLEAGKEYRVTHPYGVDEVVDDGTGVVNITEDTGCMAPPC